MIQNPYCDTSIFDNSCAESDRCGVIVRFFKCFLSLSELCRNPPIFGTYKKVLKAQKKCKIAHQTEHVKERCLQLPWVRQANNVVIVVIAFDAAVILKEVLKMQIQIGICH